MGAKVRKSGEEAGGDLLALLAKAPLFQRLEPEGLQAVHRAARLRKVRLGGTFFRQEEEARTLYLMVGGRVRLLQETADGHQTILRFLGPGEMMGSIAILGDATYPFTAQAAAVCTALAWDVEALGWLMERHPRMALNAVRILSERILELRDRVRELSSERVERRVARALLRLVRQAGARTTDGVLIDMPLSRKELAEMTGTTLFTVSRILSAWEERGLVRAGRQRVVVRQPHGLVTIAEDLES